VSPNRPELWVSQRRVGWQVEFAPCGKDDEGRQYGKSVAGRMWRGAFIDVLSLAYGLDADRSATFGEHRHNFGLAPVELPLTVAVDADGAAVVVEAVQAVYELVVVLDERAAQWFTSPEDRAHGVGRLDLARTSSPGAIAAEVLARFRVPGPLGHFDVTDEEYAAWAEALHGGWTHADRRALALPLPVVAADASSAYPLVAHLLGWWGAHVGEGVLR
jgi:hypothetical protein